MSPSPNKMLVAALTIVIFVSLTLNLVLLVRLRRTHLQVEKWKLAYDRLSDRNLLSETRPEKPKLPRSIPLKAVKPTTREDLPERPSAPLAAVQVEPELQPAEGDDPYGDLSHDDVREMLDEAIAEDFPDLELSDSEMDRLTDAVMSLRYSMQHLQTLARVPENAEARDEMAYLRDQALADFESIAGISAMEFMLHAPAEGGIDHD
jgi:hypothetical protein